MKKTLFALIISLQVYNSIAQIDSLETSPDIRTVGESSNKPHKTAVFKFSPVVNQVISYERQIRPDLTWNVTAYDSWAWAGTKGLQFNLGSKVGIRYYYNMTDRMLANKKVEKFSADYFGPEIGIYGGNLNINAIWGVQRSLGKHFYYDLNAGFRKVYHKIDDPNVVPRINWYEGYRLSVGFRIGFMIRAN